MRIVEVVSAIVPMSTAKYATYAKRRDAEQKKVVKARREKQQAEQQKLQQAQVAKSKQTKTPPIKFASKSNIRCT